MIWNHIPFGGIRSTDRQGTMLGCCVPRLRGAKNSCKSRRPRNRVWRNDWCPKCHTKLLLCWWPCGCWTTISWVLLHNVPLIRFYSRLAAFRSGMQQRAVRGSEMKRRRSQIERRGRAQRRTWCVENHEALVFQQCDSASYPHSSASSWRSHLCMNLWFPTADLTQSRSFGGFSADCRRILADQRYRGSYHHGGSDGQNTWSRRWNVPERIHGNKPTHSGNDISQDEAVSVVSVALQLYRHQSCSVSSEALCTPMSFNCTPDNRELENTPQYLAAQLIYSKVL